MKEAANRGDHTSSTSAEPMRAEAHSVSAASSAQCEPFAIFCVPFSDETLCSFIASMARIIVRPTQVDKDIARGIVRHTDVPIERAAQVLTRGADERLLVAAAAIGSLLTRKSEEPYRRLSTHVLACSLLAAILPHILKSFIGQERPDRRTIRGHWRGVPFSGQSTNAFPSGHALHIGALASVATLMPAKARNPVWAIGTVLVATRVVLLAHWFTDVLAGLGLGIAVERVLRRLTKPLPINGGRPEGSR